MLRRGRTSRRRHGAERSTGPPPQGGATRVTSLELFFDLVFVFTITQLTAVLARRASVVGLGQVAVMLGVIWWMYGGYAWLTNAVPPHSGARRAVLLLGMAAFLVQALTIPRAFAGEGLTFGLAYLAVVCVHLGLFARATSAATVRSIARLAPYNLTTAALVVAGGAAGGALQYALWWLAFALEWVTPKLIGGGGFDLAPAHFVERHGLVILVAIGESVVAVGFAASSLSVSAGVIAVAVLGLALSASLWWSYFGVDADRVERAFAAVSGRDRAQLAIDAFGYWHLLLLLGVIAIAAAERETIAQPFRAMDAGHAVGLAGGVAVYLVGIVLFRRSLRLGRGAWLGIAAPAVLATAPLGIVAGVVAQLGAVVSVLAGAFLLESSSARTGPNPDDGA
jgi:low temperature requirement protein LtrA